MKVTWANKTAFFLINATVIFTAVAYGAVHQPVIAFFYFIVAALVVLWAIDGFLSGTVRLSPELIQVPIYAAAGCGFVQVIPFGWISKSGVDRIPETISLDPYATQATALHFLALALFLSVALVVLDRAKRLRRVVMIITIFGFVFAFFAILQGVLSPTRIYGIYERQFATPYGSFVNRHNFAAYMEMTVALPLAMVLTGALKRDLRLLYMTAISLMAIALVLSGSRGGLVALLAELIVILMLTTRLHSKQKLVLRLALGGALVAAVVLGTIFVGGESSFTRIAETASSKDITTDRTHIWKVTVDVIRHSMPFGSGLGAFGVAYTPFDDLGGFERVEQAHNDYLQTLSDAGIIGLLIGGAFLYLWLRAGIGNIRAENSFRRAAAVGSFAGIFAILVHSVFDFVLHTTAIAVLFLVLVALLVAAGHSYVDDLAGTESHRARRSKAPVLPMSSR